MSTAANGPIDHPPPPLAACCPPGLQGRAGCLNKRVHAVVGPREATFAKRDCVGRNELVRWVCGAPGVVPAPRKLVRLAQPHAMATRHAFPPRAGPPSSGLAPRLAMAALMLLCATAVRGGAAAAAGVGGSGGRAAACLRPHVGVGVRSLHAVPVPLPHHRRVRRGEHTSKLHSSSGTPAFKELCAALPLCPPTSVPPSRVPQGAATAAAACPSDCLTCDAKRACTSCPATFGLNAAKRCVKVRAVPGGGTPSEQAPPTTPAGATPLPCVVHLRCLPGLQP